MDTLLQDIRYALRQLAKSPGFTVVALLTLTLGIGGTTVIFTVINGLLLRPPPQVRQPDQLVGIFTSDYSGPPFGSSSLPDALDFAKQVDVLSGLAVYSDRRVSLSAGGEPTRALAELVTGDYFRVLGVTPALGRTFRSDEGVTPGADPVAVLGWGLWQHYFGGDSTVIGRTIRLSGHPVTVVGVAPQDFTGLLNGFDVGLWVPISQLAVLQPGTSDLTSRGARFLLVVGRLKPGVTIREARARFAVLAGQLHSAYAQNWTDVHEAPRRISLVPEQQARIFPQIRGSLVGFLSILMVVAGLVLLICCANLANLLLARATARQREVAVRLALGAGRWRLVRQLLTESLVLAGLGALGGTLLAQWIAGLLGAVRPPAPVPIVLDLHLDPGVLGFALATAVATALVFGLIPALRATRPDLVPALRREQQPPGKGGRRRFALRDVLVAGQVAVSLVLLVAAGLLLRSLRNAQQIDLGFDPRGLALMSFDPSVESYPEARARQFYATLAQRLASDPSIVAVSTATLLPLGLDFVRRGISVPGYQPQPGEDMEFAANSVGPGYFEAMRIPIVRGRTFTEQDRPGAPRVAVVNETFVRRFWPGQNPIGKRLDDGWGKPLQVVGVARDGKYGSLGEEARPFFYIAVLQSPDSMRPEIDLTVIVRTERDPAAMLPALRREARALDPDLPVQLATMDQHLGLAMLPQRVGSMVLGLFGALGLALALLGLYGVLAYAVSQRTREIGIRIALGANAADVRRLMLRRGVIISAAGIVVGLLLALVAGRLITRVLFNVSPNDPLTLTAVVLVFLAAAALAAYVPARRATKVDPMVALRHE
jgi:predicted permease